MSLDLIVSQAVMRARQIEKALHDNGPWELSWGPFTVPACKFVRPNGILFIGHFPEHCWLVPPEPILTLLCRGEVHSSRVIEHPGDGQWIAQVMFEAVPEQSGVGV